MQKPTTQTLDNLGYENITENPAPAIPVHETCPPTVSATKHIGILYSYTIYISKHIGAPAKNFDGNIHVIDEHGLIFTYAFNPNNKTTFEHALQQIDEDFYFNLEPQEIITLYRFKVTQKNWYK